MTTYAEARAQLPNIPTESLPTVLAAWKDDAIVAGMVEGEIADRKMIARRVRKGYSEGESRMTLADLRRTHGKGTLGSALHYWGFITAAEGERYEA